MVGFVVMGAAALFVGGRRWMWIAAGLALALAIGLFEYSRLRYDRDTVLVSTTLLSMGMNVLAVVIGSSLRAQAK